MLEYLIDDTKPNFLAFLYLSETYNNLFAQHTEQKKKISHHVYDMLQKSYADQGGVHGSGFESPEDMVHKIPMWKVHKKLGKVRAVSMYKDDGKNGRKMVAIATDGSAEGKAGATDMLKSDLKMHRAHTELSGKALSHIKKHTNLADHLHTFEQAKAYHASRGDTVTRPAANDPEVLLHPELKDHFYTREIGGQKHTKVLLGATGKTIK